MKNPPNRYNLWKFIHPSVLLKTVMIASKSVLVYKVEEKKTDVNIAVYRLNDAWKDEYDYAVLVSNDSDLSENFNLIKQNFNVKVLGLSVSNSQPTNELIVDFKPTITIKHLKRNQLSQTKIDSIIKQ